MSYCQVVCRTVEGERVRVRVGWRSEGGEECRGGRKVSVGRSGEEGEE